jgi:hypothetical protein
MVTLLLLYTKQVDHQQFQNNEQLKLNVFN